VTLALAKTEDEYVDVQAECRLWISRLSLTEFRSYASLEKSFDGRPVILTGENGAGKTNVLEAVSFLNPGKGMRKASLSDVRRKGLNENPYFSGWAVSADLSTAWGMRKLGTGFTDENGGEKRQLKLDGEPAKSQKAFAEVMPVIWLTPAMDGLFREGTTARRQFFDQLVSAFCPGHSSELAAYNQSMSERQRIMKEANFRGTQPDAFWLSSLEESMARHAVIIASNRRFMIDQLNSACELSVGSFPAAELSLVGALEQAVGLMPALEIEDRFAKELEFNRGLDQQSGRCTLGTHRTDFIVHHRGKNLHASDCSTGEQKSLLLSIVLAHARLVIKTREQTPVLLLDEVVAHLDEKKRADLFEEIVALNVQAWMTGTDKEQFTALETGLAQKFDVSSQQLHPYQG